MESLEIIIAALSFSLSFIFALGGVGAAVMLIPVLTWLGVPLNLARPTGLFVNTVSMSSATVSNFRARRLDIRLGLPIIATSLVLAPVGAWVGHMVPTRAILLVFIGFLLFSGTMMLFFKSAKYADQYREDRPVLGPLLVGVVAGFFSGLLGVGGGGLISPLMILQGFNPKKVATVTAFAVPFSSFSGFVTYAAMGSISLRLLVFAGLAAWGGGLLGTKVMQQKMLPGTVKKMLGGVLLLLAVKLLFQIAM